VRLLQRKKYVRSIEFAEKTFVRVCSSRNKRFFKFRQFWQYALERTYYRAGKGRVGEPHFICKASKMPGLEAVPVKKVDAGMFETGWTHLGMRLDGFVFDKTVNQVQIFIDGNSVRSIGLYKIPLAPNYFHYHIKREVLNTFPAESILEIKTSDGRPLVSDYGKKVKLYIPHGTGELGKRLINGASINKKGFYAPTKEDVIKKQNRYLKIYEKARDYFDNNFESPLFILYGTLLGSYRGGDFIPGDDDFDAGYISIKNSAAEVKEETINLVVDLVLNGFTCSFNRKGRLFRLRLAEDTPDVHLDLRPVWYEDGAIWAHKQARLDLTVEDFLPVKSVKLRNSTVYQPNNTEAFVRAYYGPGWKVPDPGYSNSTIIPRYVTKKLASICINPGDYEQMLKEIEKRRTNYPGAGKLISIGSYDLYPLEDFEKDCEW